jgi:hypothetical protein
MESTDLISPDPADREIETLLRQQPAPLSPDEFTSRVLAALPTRGREPVEQSYARRIFVLTGAVAGSALVLTQIESLPALRNDWMTFIPRLEQVAAALAAPPAFAALTVASVSALYAFLAATTKEL